ncbi:aromatic-ring-hydroxylating dioxygenase subunit beta [Marinomonas spartinae]|uniref:aromatic-ring-hydroxylating dioxygenase subunit beta n=1 Tax=Marinomonas spartinae TaxID=1792290 RepID=UPI0018F145B1|nr:aromatic-ring-hydroxylating dioxygenase subunit beta [Marinomonas spartinae]MBJ7554858.1 hypothetical protein [Marinomonas spartinae]
MRNNIIHHLEDLVYLESKLLDEQRYEEWLGLLDDSFTSWIPLTHNQVDPLYEPSLLYEDRFITQLRIKRLNNSRSFSQQPRSRSQHLLQRPEIIIEENNSAANSLCQLIYTESRGEQEWSYAARLEHSFLLIGSNWKIVSKKTVLLSLGKPLDSLQLII